jgi:HK97 family phage major capsid protein/HK97 family phage prohead protease
MPTPHPDTETRDEFISRCVPMLIEEGSEQDQAVAICSSMWEQATKNFTRAYSILNVKAISDDKRVITGIATTPEPDRLGDIIEPMGIKFKNPSPLLWQHKKDKPVGTVTFKKPTKDGMEFEARLPKIDEPGILKMRVDEAWQSVKHGLVTAVSIGFRDLKSSFMKDGGIRFLQSEVLELSLVTVAANSDATIQQIKSIDAELRAASGWKTAGELSSPSPSAASGQQTIKPPGAAGKVKLITPKEAKMTKTVAEQIGAFEATRAAKSARMEAIMAKAAEAGETLADEESQEYDGLEIDVKKIDEHLKRLATLEEANKKAARPVSGNGGDPIASAASARSPIISVKANVPPGTAFTRLAMAMMAAKGNRWEALNIAKQWHDQSPEVELVLSADVPQMMRAAIGTGTTTDATWASPLIAYTQMASEYIELLRPATIVGRVPNFRRVPFNIQMPRGTTGSSMGWVGENSPKPVTSMAFDTVQLRWAKAAGIIVMTEELVRFSNPAAEGIVRGDMIAAMAQFLDRQFVDPSVVAVTNVSPASITNGVTPITASGVTAAAFFNDVRLLFGEFFEANLSTAGGVWIMTQTQALALSLIQNTLGQNVFPTISATGGTLLGYPVIASENIPATGSSPVDGFPIIFFVPSEVLLADDGQVVIDASNQASVQMDTAPDSPPTASTNLVSLWQMNMVGLRAERWVNWLKRRTAAAQFIQNAKYTG